ncbi:uncharacterized protein LOC129595463 [Paramacrobiotus metropolitanus]|uniref:uncharacterized protein LOC129595463 n=1 Tax=Paramacrobiotus metropolitanus TaxID=2943436 RepID=UPI0024464238|nr:uncharacterized protein LOC129595463 [Paramacrobiotus metropolitanus]XP_055348461.1 uncharacterized protein LOC129595463 [Paramacrobiotus metropolitanus]
MHLYGEKRFECHPVYQWNSVDVLTESGLFQHVEVIDVAENGLIVDFQSNEQRAQFVSYDKIFHASIIPNSVGAQRQYKLGYAELQWSPSAIANARVQVLWRSQPGAAWLWYPAWLLNRAFSFPFNDICLVWAAVEVEGRRHVELFSADQVRFPPSKKRLAERVIHPGSFVSRECRLPVEFWPNTTHTAADNFSRHPPFQDKHVRILSVLGETVKYLQRSDAEPITEEDVQKVYDATREFFSKQPGLSNDEQDNPALQLSSVRKTTRKRKYSEEDAQPEVECVLPAATHLLLEIFHSLDSLTRIKLRRVSPLWNTVLTGADSAKTVRVSFVLNPFFPREAENFTQVFGAVAGLLKCTNASTERIILEDMWVDNFDGALMVIKYLLQNIRLKQLTFHNVVMDWDDRFDEDYAGSGVVAVEELEGGGKTFFRRLAKTLNSWAPCCDELRLRRCTFTCIEKMNAVIQHATIKLDAADIEAQFWDLYEAHLSRDGVNLEEMAEWIRTGSEELRNMVAQYLEDWQSYDPRSTTQYRGQEWTVDNLKDLDVSKLTTITLRALKERLPEEMKD